MMIQVLGPRNSGTHITMRMLMIRINRIPRHVIDYETLSKFAENNPNVTILCMYRPLKNWIKSIQKAPYDIVVNPDQTVRCRNGNYKNLTELYNEYYRTYMKLIRTYPNVTWLDYYKVIDPSSDYMKRFGNVNYTVLEVPAKRHGNPVKNWREAMAKKDDVGDIDAIEDAEITAFFSEDSDPGLIGTNTIPLEPSSLSQEQIYTPEQLPIAEPSLPDETLPSSTP